jgi:hypothetical protein
MESHSVSSNIKAKMTMKKLLIIVFSCTLSLILKAQIPLPLPYISADGTREHLVPTPDPAHHAPKSQWAKTTAQTVLHKYYAVTDYDINAYGSDVLEIDSFIYLNGEYRDRPPGALKTSIWKPFTMKLNQQGEKIWVRTDSLDMFNHWGTWNRNIIQLADGNILSLYCIDHFDTIQRFMRFTTALIKRDTAGNKIWSKMVTLPDTLGELLWSIDIVAEPDSGFTTQAYSVSESRSLTNDSTFQGDTTFMTIVKFDKYGTIERMNRFLIGTQKVMVMGSGIIKTDDGGYLLAGHTEFKDDSTYHTFYNRKYFLIKVDSLFDQQWTKVFDQSTNFYVNKLCIANSATGGYLFATTDGDYSYPVYSGYIHYGKIDDHGNVLWHNYHGKLLHPNGFWAASAAPMGITDDALGNVVIASQVNSLSGAYLFCTDTLGNEKWSRWLPYWGEILYNMRSGEHGGYLLTGIGAGAWLAKTDSIGCVMPGCMDTLMFIGMEEMQQLKKEELIVYPNPATSELYFALNQETEQIKTIELYDMQGRMVAMQQPNNTLATLHIPHLPNGIYIARVSLKNRVITRKVVKR